MAKAKKKSSTSKKAGRPKKAVREGTIKVPLDYKGQDPKFIKYEDVSPDLEDLAGDVDDEASKHKYPPPRKHPLFRKVWMQFIDSMVRRENFKEGHLNSLEVLCDLHVEYELLRKFLRVNGQTYQSVGRAGVQFKFYPQVDQLNKVQTQIANYMRMLSLLPKKDASTGADSKPENNEWE